MDKRTKHYIKKVSSKMKCSRSKKAEYIETLSGAIEDYISEHPDCTEKEIINYFDTPSKVASEYMEDINPEEINNYILSQRRLKRLILIISIMILIGIAIAIYIIITSEARLVDERIF